MSQTNKTIDQKRNELNELIAWFDSEVFQLEEAFEKYKVAEKLAREIEADLMNLKNEINVLKKKFDEEA